MEVARGRLWLSMTNPSTCVYADPASPVSSASHDGQRMSCVAGVLSSVHSCRSHAPMHVNSMWNGIEMIGPHASAHPAQMIQLGVCGDRTYEKLVGHSMRSQQRSRSSISPDHSVTICSGHPCPQPAVVGLLDLRPDSIYQRNSLRRHGYMVTPMEKP